MNCKRRVRTSLQYYWYTLLFSYVTIQSTNHRATCIEHRAHHHNSSNTIMNTTVIKCQIFSITLWNQNKKGASYVRLDLDEDWFSRHEINDMCSHWKYVPLFVADVMSLRTVNIQIWLEKEVFDFLNVVRHIVIFFISVFEVSIMLIPHNIFVLIWFQYDIKMIWLVMIGRLQFF